jgi:hypothetical protein
MNASPGYMRPGSLALVTALAAVTLLTPRAHAVTCDPSYFPAPDEVFFRNAAVQTSRFSQPTTFWAGFGLLTDDGATDFDLYMYSSCSGGYLAGSNAGLGRTDFVLGDFNYNPTEADNAVDIPCYSGNCGAPYAGAATWRTGGFLFVDFPPTTVDFTASVPPYNPDMIMHVWDVYLTAGNTYYFQFSSSLGDGMKMLLFRNKNQGVYWTGRNGAEFEVSGCTSYTAPASGYYGLVVVNDVWALGSYTVGVTTQPTCACASPLPEHTPVAVPSPQTIDYAWTPAPAYNGWQVVGERPASGGDWDLEVDSSAGSPGCGQSLLANSAYGGTAVDFVMTDFSHVAPVTLAPHTYRYSGGAGATFEWNGFESLADELETNGPQVTEVWGASDVLRCWTYYMVQGQTYTFQFAASSNMKVLLFQNPGSGLYSAGRGNAVLQASSDFSYTAPADGNYGVVVVKDDDQTGYYALRVGTCTGPFPLTAGQSITGGGSDFWWVSIQPQDGHWQALGTRCLTADWDVNQYGSTTPAAWPDCFSPLGAVSESSTIPDFVVGDFNVNPPGVYPFRLKQYSSGDAQDVTMEWTGAAPSIGVNDPALNASPTAGEVLRIYQAFLVGGRTYQIGYAQSATRPLLVFGNPGVTPYWAPRSTALLSTLSSTSFTPASSGYYGFVIANDAAETGSFSLRITTNSTLDAGDGPRPYVTRLGDVTPNPAPSSAMLHFSLASASRVRFHLIDATGRRVWSSPDADFSAGEWSLPLDRAAGGTRLGAGLYFVEFVVDGRETETRKVVLLQ